MTKPSGRPSPLVRHLARKAAPQAAKTLVLSPPFLRQLPDIGRGSRCCRSSALAEFLGQIAPWCAGARHPEYLIDLRRAVAPLCNEVFVRNCQVFGRNRTDFMLGAQHRKPKISPDLEPGMRGAAMVEYRWCLIGPDDKVSGVEYADCPSDADAMMRAEQLLRQRRDLGGVEVWAMDKKRLVGRAPRVEHQSS